MIITLLHSINSLLRFKNTNKYYSIHKMSAICDTNPLLMPWTTKHQVPPFQLINTNHFEEAFNYAMEVQMNELLKVCSVPEINFDTIVAPFDRSANLYNRVSLVYDNLCLSVCTPELQEVQLKLAGPIAAHSNKIYMYPGLFERIKFVYDNRLSTAWNLNFEQIRLVERFYLDFVRSGANFDSEKQGKYARITEKLAELETQFSQNVLGDESNYIIELTKDDLTGLPESIKSAAKQAAEERNLGPDVYVITLSRSLVEPFITFSDRRDLREKAWRAWTKRGELDLSRDNSNIITEILLLRKQQATLHGYASYSEYQTADTMAGNPKNVMQLLENVWNKGKTSIDRERAALMEYISSVGSAIDKIEPWDWRFYAEKVNIIT